MDVPGNRSLKSGDLAVGDGHELYYERVGQRKPMPILFVHGGPGSGFTEGHKNLFDSARFDAVFFDQRGSGKSQPYCSLEGNTTQNLVEDIEKLRQHFNIEKWVLVGASWGATLALLYAEAYPARVSGLSLMSVFLATREESRRFVDGSTAKAFPAIWERFASVVPENERDDTAHYYLTKMLHGSEEEQEHYAYNWALYDLSLSTGESSEEKVGPLVRSISYRSLALMTAYYIVNDFFLPDNAVLDSAPVLAKIPLAIVHGAHDPVTPPAAAKKLHATLPSSTLHMLDGLHVSAEMKKLFIAETARLAGGK